VPRIAIFDVAPANLPVFDPLSPGGGGSISIMCWCRMGEEDDNERKWKALRTIYLASCQNGISSSQHDRYSQDEFRSVWLQVAGVTNHPAIAISQSDGVCLLTGINCGVRLPELPDC